jgi:serine/threonine protein phosphatase 1
MKYFCVSDIHGYYNELLEALKEAGFDRNDPDHTLISCGDNFDRGRQPTEVLNYLLNLPRKILIRGNHEDLLADACERERGAPYDESNGTIQTIWDLSRPFATEYKAIYGKNAPARKCFVAAGKQVAPLYKHLINYYETQNYIFVHAWIPVMTNDGMPYHYLRDRYFSTHPNWRQATPLEWSQARWLNPFAMAKNGFLADKTIICGHWHCSYGHMLDSIKTDNWLSEFEENAVWDPYYGSGFIAIDRCTAHTGKINVLVLDDEPL